MEDKLATMTVEQRAALDKDLLKKEKKEDAKEEREKARIAVRFQCFAGESLGGELMVRFVLAVFRLPKLRSSG